MSEILSTFASDLRERLHTYGDLCGVNGSNHRTKRLMFLCGGGVVRMLPFFFGILPWPSSEKKSPYRPPLCGNKTLGNDK